MPKLRLHCPACGFTTLTVVPLLRRPTLNVTCPKCRERFPLAEGLVAERSTGPQLLKGLGGWLLIPVAYPLLLVFFGLLSILFAILAPAVLAISLFKPQLTEEAGGFSRLGFVLFAFWPPVIGLLLLLPLLVLYRLGWMWQPQPWLPPLSVLAGVTPNQLAQYQVVAAALAMVFMLLYLLRMVPARLAQLRELQLLVPSKARSASMGLVELEGVLRIAQPADAKEAARWYLEDDSGRIPVDPQRQGPAELPVFDDELYLCDAALADGDYVYLLGHVHPNPQAPPEALDAERLVVRPVGAALFPGALWRQLFRRQSALHETPSVFVLAPGGERHAQRLLRRRLIVHAAQSLLLLGAAVWLIGAEVPRLDGYDGWTTAELAGLRTGTLAQLLLSGDQTLQRRAAPVFFGRWDGFGTQDPQRPEWLAPTLELLGHPDAATRNLALRAAGSLQSAAEQVAPTLLGLTGAPHPDQRAGAARALGRLQALPAESIPALTALLRHDADAEVRTAACIALAGFDQADPLSSACLRERLMAASGEGRRELARALSVVTGDAREVVPFLTGLLTDADPQVRRAAAQGLGDHGPAAAGAAVQIIAALAAETDETVRYPLLLTCGAIGPAAAPAVPLLLEEFRTLKPPHTRRDTILSVLRGIGAGAAAAQPQLLSLLDDSSVPGDEQRAALIILDSFGTAAEAVPAAQRLAETARDGETRRIAEWFVLRHAGVE